MTELDISEKLPDYCLGSFDIGSRNLGMCIIDKNTNVNANLGLGFCIREWQLINLVSQVGRKKLVCGHIIKGKKGKADKKCGKNATYWIEANNQGFCTTHSKMKSKSLLEENTVRNTMGNEEKTVGEEEKTVGDEKLVRYTTTRNITDLELNRMIIEELEKYPDLWRRCTEVMIESQIRAEMKKIAYMIFCFLSYKIVHDPLARLKDIKNINAGHKLAITKGVSHLPDEIQNELMNIYVDPSDLKGKNNYKKRKDLSDQYCKILCKNSRFDNFYSSSKKKDDLADSFLQGLWFLLNK